MNSLLLRLKPNQRRGSKPRCHFLTHGSAKRVAERLTALIAPWGSVAASDQWMPQGFDVVPEAQLGTAARLIPDDCLREALRTWWLVVQRRAQTPNWDIASTCTIDGKPGLLLVEAKAHDAELRHAAKGKRLSPSASSNSRSNHDCIGACIQEANIALSQATGLAWNLSRDRCYQMSNRFAWAWKLNELGIPVILVHLGFLHCQEMKTTNQLPFAEHDEWERLVKGHSAALFPPEVWDRRWCVHGRSFIPLIRTLSQPLGEDS